MPSDRCTWVGCAATGHHQQVAKDGSVWAMLCETHLAEFNAAYEPFNVKKVLSTWVKAQGGAKSATKRMLPHAE